MSSEFHKIVQFIFQAAIDKSAARPYNKLHNEGRAYAMTLREKLKAYREEHDISQRQFALRCGLSNGYIAMIERGENPSTGEPIKPSLEAMNKMAAGMGVPVARLLAEVEDIPVDLGTDWSAADNVAPMPGLRRVPRLGSIACGEPILAQQNIEDYDQVPDFIKCDFTLTCRGDSMINARIHDGDLVCIKSQPEVENGQIAAVLILDSGEDGATLKRVRYIDGGVALWPENPAYAPMIFTGSDVDRVRVLGLATHFVSRVI